jgi:chitodextrinase
MKMRKAIFIGLACCGTITAANAWAAPASSNVVSYGKVVNTFDVPRGSPEYDQIRAWLTEAITRTGDRVGSPANLSSDSLGASIHVQVVHQVTTKGSVAAMGAPIMPPPPWTPGTSGYRVGDSAIVSITNGGWTQTWSLSLQNTSMGLMWLTTEYHATRDPVDQPPLPH